MPSEGAGTHPAVAAETHAYTSSALTPAVSSAGSSKQRSSNNRVQRKLVSMSVLAAVLASVKLPAAVLATQA